MKMKYILAAIIAALLACAAFAPQALPLVAIAGGAALMISHQSRIVAVSNTVAEDLLTLPPHGYLSRSAEAALTKHGLVYEGASAGGVRANSASTKPIGVAYVDGSDVAIASGDLVTVQTLSSGIPCWMVANGAISRGAEVFGAASQKVQPLPGTTGTYQSVGWALTAASNDGDLIQVLPHAPRPVAVA